MMISLIFMLGLMSMVFKYKHLIMIMMSLELMMLTVFVMFMQYLSSSSVSSSIFIILSMIAGEGALGLSLLVRYIRTNNSDQFLSMNLMKL